MIRWHARARSLSLQNRITLVTLLVFLLGIWTVTLYATRSLRDDFIRVIGNQQYSTVSTLASQLNDELADGLAQLGHMAGEIDPELLQSPQRLQDYLVRHSEHIRPFNGGLRVSDHDGRTLASFPYSEDRIGVSYADRDYMISALKDGRPNIGKPAIGKILGTPVIGLAYPIKSTSGQTIGAVVGAIILGDSSIFQKIVKTRYGQTGGYLIIAPRHHIVVAGTDSGRNMTPTPPQGANIMNDRYVAGYEGYGIALNSRGIEEISAAKRIPVADWLLVSVLPTAEAFAPLSALQQRVLMSALLLSMLAGALAWWLVRRTLRKQFAPMLAATEALTDMSSHNHIADQPLDVKRQDEVGRLIGSFNVLLDSLRQRELALKDSEQHYRTLANGGSALIWTPGTDKQCNYVNEPWLRFTGRTLEQETGQGRMEGIHPDDFAQCQERFTSHFERHEAFSMEYRLRHASGDYRWILDDAAPRYDSDGNFIGYIGFCHDITERKLATDALLRAASVFSHAREGIVVTSTDGTIVDANEAFTRITGFTREEAIGRNPNILRSGSQPPEFYESMWKQLIEQGHWTGEIWNRRKNGEVYAELLTISSVCDSSGKPTNYIGLFSDITAQKEHQRELESIAHYDPLTGLPNRVLLGDRLRQAMRQSERRNLLLGVAYIDLDGFKSINDNFGHQTGDQFLIAVAQAMKDALREGDTIARLGGDEFVVILLDLPSHQIAAPLLERLLAAAARPIHLHGTGHRVSASIGVTFYPQSEPADADQLLRQADQAMYQAKLAGKNRYHFFDIEQDRSTRGRHESIERIREAIDNDEFTLYYQPKVNMRDGSLVGTEALLRWRHPERGMLLPAEFLPAIEEHALGKVLGEWVIAQALAQISRWQKLGHAIPVSINVGAYQLQQPDFVQRLSAAMALHPEVSPSLLQLEVLETSALEELAHVSKVIAECRQLGIHFALDDFGTGYSSLTYLKRLPAQALKIDQSFVRDMLDNADDLAILEGIIGFAHAFARELIAEGVETEAHGELLLQLGCELGQGFGIAQPMPGNDMPTWVGSWTPPAAWTAARRIGRDALPALYAMVEHRSWIRQVTAYLSGQRDTPPDLDPGLCRFGSWLGSRLVKATPEEIIEITAASNLHEQAHRLARELISDYHHGQRADISSRLAELEHLRDALTRSLFSFCNETADNRPAPALKTPYQARPSLRPTHAPRRNERKRRTTEQPT